MKIQFDIEEITKLKLSPLDYTILYLINEKEYKLLEGFALAGFLDFVDTVNYQGILKHLEINGWIKIAMDEENFAFKDVQLRQKAIELFEEVKITHNQVIQKARIPAQKSEEKNKTNLIAEKKNKSLEGIKLIGLICAVIFVIVLLVGIFNGIGETFAKVPWWGEVIFSIGFISIIFYFSNDSK